MATAQEKFELGYLMSENDYKELLRDANSPLSKLRQACEAEVALEEYFIIRFMECARVAEQSARRKAAEFDEKVYARAEERRQKETRFNTELNARKELNVIPQSKENLKSALTLLLAESPTSMNAAQLVDHYYRLMNNFNQQVLANLGPTVTLSNGLTLKVPTTVAPEPVASISKVIAVNPGLAEQVAAHPGMDEALAVFHANNAAGPLAVINTTTFMFEKNGIDPDTVAVAHRRELMQRISNEMLSIRQDQPELYKQAYLDISLTLQDLLRATSEERLTDEVSFKPKR